MKTLIMTMLIGLYLGTPPISAQTVKPRPSSGRKPVALAPAAPPAQGQHPVLTAQLGHSKGVTSVAFSPDGRYVLTGSADGTARLWDAATGKEVRRKPPASAVWRNGHLLSFVSYFHRLDKPINMPYNHRMKQTIALKLETTLEQHQALLETMHAFNAGCDYVAEVAFRQHSANKIALQPLVYGELRSRFGLSSQMAVRAISKACEAYKRDKSVKPSFDPEGAVIYDERLMSVKDAGHVSLLTLSGRILAAMRYGAYQAARLDRQKGQADLILRDGVFYLYICIDLPTPPPVATEGYLGVDLGIVEIATDSTGKQYSGDKVKAVRQRVKEHRRQLQKKQTNSAKKRLRKIARRQSRFVRDVNHCISKQIVQTARTLQKALALEQLDGIRDRAQHGCKAMRWLLGNWSFRQLREFLSYKAAMAGLSVVFVDPRNTSRTCSFCGHCDKQNRKSQAHFHCTRCGLACNADVNAALNIQARAAPSYRLLSSAA